MEKILLVEDDPMISEIYQKKMTQSGYDVEVSMSGEDALKKMQSNTYDLVLLDLVLPGLDGSDVLKELSGAGSKSLPSPVVVFSNLNDSDNQEMAFQYGAIGFVEKSHFNPSEMLNEVERFIRESKEQRRNKQRVDDQASGKGGAFGSGDQKHLLFVEDEQVFINLFTERLKKEGFQVTVAETGAQALEVIEKGGIDLIISDMLLPVMRGDEFVAQVRRTEIGKDLPIIIISASALDEQMEEMKKYGIQEFFLKTRITPSELVGEIKKVMGLK